MYDRESKDVVVVALDHRSMDEESNRNTAKTLRTSSNSSTLQHTYIHTYIHTVHTYIHTYTHTYIFKNTYIMYILSLVFLC